MREQLGRRMDFEVRLARSSAIAAEFPGFAVAIEPDAKHRPDALLAKLLERFRLREAHHRGIDRRFVWLAWENRDPLVRAIGEDSRAIQREIARRCEASAAAFGALVSANDRHAVVAGERAHAPRPAVEQCLALALAQPTDQSPDGSESFAKPLFVRGHRFEDDAPVADLKGNVVKAGFVGQAHAVGAGDAGRSAQPREQVAEIVQRLRVDELAERFADQGHVRAVQQMMDVLRSAKHQPVERKLEQIAAGLNVDVVGRPRLRSESTWISSRLVTCSAISRGPS